MLDKSVTLSESDEELRANQQQNLADGMSLFPKLQRGLDVNVGFTKIDAFEYSEDQVTLHRLSPSPTINPIPAQTPAPTLNPALPLPRPASAPGPKQVIFDLLNVRLVHGWLSDPQDAATHGVVGMLTYNQLVEKVIEVSSLSQPSTPARGAPAPAPVPVLAPAPAARASEDDPEEAAELAAALQLSLNGEAFSAPASTPPSPPPSPPSLPSPPSPPPTPPDAPLPQQPLQQPQSPPQQQQRSGDDEDDEAPRTAMVLSMADNPSTQPAAQATAAPPPSAGVPSAGAAPPSFTTAHAMPAPAAAALVTNSPASAEAATAADVDAYAAAAGAAADAADEQKSKQLQEGLLAQDWLNRSAAQLTYLGLEQLHQHLEERTLVVFFCNNCDRNPNPNSNLDPNPNPNQVFFRNNHFSTLTKHGGELYLLATDIGYLHETDVVWERLNQARIRTRSPSAPPSATLSASLSASPPHPPHRPPRVPPYPPLHPAPRPRSTHTCISFLCTLPFCTLPSAPSRLRPPFCTLPPSAGRR